jgi:hypothetical protein
MKNLYVAGFFGLCCLCTSHIHAQDAITVKQHITDKPFAFQQIPERVPCNKKDLDNLLKAEPASRVSFSLDNQTTLQGVVTEKVVRSKQSYSLNIKLENFPGALFNLLVVIEEGNIPRFSGRIINPQSGDVLILQQDKQQYYFKKQLQRYFMTE